ncbi:MAG: type IV toxin-antitoxin system AbiEi family antitoxin domain-containing protein [Kiritimatiellales bacterium]|nr:type IV toxin-antitoxin system AbiEi family antitoxin domain-containing protein [Kiritimatiellota bacterium]MBL7015951.1 type IV toxin-antitoxin system AbiEi family antitoxin domain-containing protein [Kiritimatiellales bacterium]
MNDKIKTLFSEHGGQLRMRDALNAGMSRYMLYNLYEKGFVERIARGVYRLADLPPISEPDFMAISTRCPKAVLCLISALSLHEITTEIPRQIFIALPRDTRAPTMKYPPLSIHKFSEPAYSEGIEVRDMDGVGVKVYCVEKTLADCFKYRNKIGMDVVLEALKFYRERYRFDGNKIMHYAKVCRVDNIMRPYLEATL